MISLPDGVPSVATALAATPPSSPAATPLFDWQSLVWDARPGTVTEAQRHQATRVANLHDTLHEWMHGYGLPDDHLAASEVLAVGTTSPHMSEAQTLLVAQMIIWISVLDEVLDTQDLSAPQALAQCDSDVYAVLQPLLSRGTQNLIATPTVGASHLAVNLASALRDFLDRLPNGDMRRQLIESTLVDCIRAMQHEITWSFHWIHQRNMATVPSLTTYLKVARQSIGLHVMAALVCTFQAAITTTWSQHQKVLEAGATLIRLANDAQTYTTDATERHLTTLAVILHTWGALLPEDDVRTSMFLPQAKSRIATLIAQALRVFVRAQRRTPASELSLFVQHAVAFALALYQ